MVIVRPSRAPTALQPVAVSSLMVRELSLLGGTPVIPASACPILGLPCDLRGNLGTPYSILPAQCTLCALVIHALVLREESCGRI